jgi:hypothetical protein
MYAMIDTTTYVASSLSVIFRKPPQKGLSGEIGLFTERREYSIINASRVNMDLAARGLRLTREEETREKSARMSPADVRERRQRKRDKK